MSTPSTFSIEYLDQVQLWIEFYITKLMDPDTIELRLESEKNVPPYVTTAVWKELEDTNPEFFRAYRIRSRIRDQVILLRFLKTSVSAARRKSAITQLNGMFPDPL